MSFPGFLNENFCGVAFQFFFQIKKNNILLLLGHFDLIWCFIIVYRLHFLYAFSVFIKTY